MEVVYFASSLGQDEPRVLARFITDSDGLHSERFDRRGGRWIQDSGVAGFLTGQDDWAEQITHESAKQILRSWSFSPSILEAPVVAVATT